MGWEIGLTVIIVQVMSIGQARVPLFCSRLGWFCAGRITLGLELGCLDRRKELNPGSLSAFLLSRSDYRC